MMKKLFFAFFLFALFFNSLPQASAQSSHNSSSSMDFFSTSGSKQWVKDLRRFDIIAFGSFPFSMFFVNFFFDMYRWNKANGMDFSEAGRRYAPWPLKSAGAVDKTGSEYTRTILMAAGVSLVFALTDYLIVRIKRNREQLRLENMPPSGSVDIERRPLVSVESNSDPPDIYTGNIEFLPQPVDVSPTEEVLQPETILQPDETFQPEEVSQPEAVMD